MKHFHKITEKLKEADFFLDKMILCERCVDEMNYYFSAFASAARSVTFVMQYVGSSIEGFSDWYSAVRAKQGADKISKYLLEARNESQKTGAQPISYGEVVKLPSGEEKLIHFFSYVGSNPPADIPDIDVLSTCQHQMKNLVNITAEFFSQFESAIWNPAKERSEVLEHLNQVKPLVLGGTTPQPMWEQVTAFISSDRFQPPRPIETIRHLVAKHA
ncbi:hypothetical protein [Polaromonas sp. UBA4122]|uniref:hypothetical protein n=1 Tax=Polaromonas sp. UBA4122 TaxID=1947074 RepID=UPI0025E86B6F|nr:hypothetical protein [Polaromonas sp. UBA4122]